MQVTLCTNGFATIDVKMTRIHDRVGLRRIGLTEFDVFSTGTMTSLASNRFLKKRRIAKPIGFVANEIRQSRMARQAASGHASFKTPVALGLVVGRQSPFPPIGKPRNARLEQQTSVIDDISTPPFAGTKNIRDGNGLVIKDFTA